MRLLLLIPFLALSAASPVQAAPVDEARSAMGACLAAVIDKAPVETAKGHDVDIRRDGGFGPCTVEVRAGAPAEVREAVLAAINARREKFLPAKTAWDPGVHASQETFCNAAVVRRALNVVVTTSKPDAGGLMLTATVLEPRERDPRCDADLGLQPAPLG